MKSLIILISISLVGTACTNNDVAKATIDTVKRDTIIKPDTLLSTQGVEAYYPAHTDTSSSPRTDIDKATKESSKDVLAYIRKFTEWDFRESRKQLIEDSREQQYRISAIKKVGGTLKYDVVIPGIEVKMDYTCIPDRGELSIIMFGDKDVAQMHFQQNKVGLTWENCNKTDVAEQCETYQDMQEEPLKTHFTISLVNHRNVAIFTLHRQILPK